MRLKSLLIIFALVVAGVLVSSLGFAANPQLSVTLNKSSLSPGATLQLNVLYQKGSENNTVDLYVALHPPAPYDNQLLFVSSGGGIVFNTPTPYKSSWAVKYMSETVFQYLIGETVEKLAVPGTWKVYVVMTKPGSDVRSTANWVGSSLDKTFSISKRSTTAAPVTVEVSVSTPANGSYFVEGEKPVLSISFTGSDGKAMGLSDLVTANLYLYGPRNPAVIQDSSASGRSTGGTKTAVKLLNATGDRNVQPHHYINLKTTKNTNLDKSGTTLTYTLEAISDEEPGTYTGGVWANHLTSDPSHQDFGFGDFQMKTATVQSYTVDKEKCAQCHRSTNKGKLQLAHSEKTTAVRVGNFALDKEPVRTCKSCHNWDGYSRTPIIRRVHQVHRGEGLKYPGVADPYTGIADPAIANYKEVKFPADLRNCEYCHVTDSWKNNPSRVACWTCHDRVNFTTGENHGGGAQANDNICANCHPPSGAKTSVLKPIATVHQFKDAEEGEEITIELSEPANGKYFVAGEKPVITAVVKDKATGKVLTLADLKAYNMHALFVNGPKQRTKPVLTSVAVPVSQKPGISGSWAYDYVPLSSDTLAKDPNLAEGDGATYSFKYNLNAISNEKPGTYTSLVSTRKLGGTANVPDKPWVNSVTHGMLQFQIGTAKVEADVSNNCKNCHANTRMHTNLAPFDPNYCKDCHDYDANNRAVNTDAIATTPIGGRIYGSSPIVWKVHKVHFGKYLSSPDKSRDIHNTTDHAFDNIIWPMDVRNCTKCHGMRDNWKNNPGYIACIACHDTENAVAHAVINSTWETDADTGRKVIKAESCPVCHKAGREFAVDKVHDYSTTYPREDWTIAGEED